MKKFANRLIQLESFDASVVSKKEQEFHVINYINTYTKILLIIFEK